MQNPELKDLTLTSKWKSHLLKANYLTSTEVLLTPPSTLAKRTKLSLADIDELLLELSSAVSAPTRTGTRTVAELLGLGSGKEEQDADADAADGLVDGALGRVPSQDTAAPINDWITTGDEGLDGLLGNGVRVGSITEITGQSASGKSHLCLQLSLAAQLPPSLGGLSGGTIFISSEGIVPSSRLLSLARSLISRPRPPGSSSPPTEWDLLDNVHTEKAQDVETLSALLSYIAPAHIERVAAAAASSDLLPAQAGTPDLPERTTTRLPPLPIKLIVVDSIAAPFRAAHGTDSAGFVERAKELNAVGDSLKRLAYVYSCAVVVVNQVSDVFDRDLPALPRALPLSTSAVPSRGTSPAPFAHSSSPSPLRPAHEQYGLPLHLYNRYQSLHFSGQTPELRTQAALGHSWANIVNTRVMLSRTRRRRFAAIEDDADSGRGRGTGGSGGQIDENGDGRGMLVRRMTMVFSPFAQRASVDYVLEEEGVTSLGYPVLRRSKWDGEWAVDAELDSGGGRS